MRFGVKRIGAFLRHPRHPTQDRVVGTTDALLCRVNASEQKLTKTVLTGTRGSGTSRHVRTATARTRTDRSSSQNAAPPRTRFREPSQNLRRTFREPSESLQRTFAEPSENLRRTFKEPSQNLQRESESLQRAFKEPSMSTL